MRAYAGNLEWQRRLFDNCSCMMTRLTELPQPVIARVHGIATAAGCQLVAMCNLAVAADTASFALGMNIGVFCSTPAVGVARNVGRRKRAMELLLTGEPVDTHTALAWGLVNRVAPIVQLDAEASLHGARSWPAARPQMPDGKDDLLSADREAARRRLRADR